MSLYLDRDLVDGLATSDPYTRLDAANLKEFCTALEGVSHFVYLLFNATHQRPVSRLELELQAEVDKFFAVWMLSATQGRALDVESLSAWLFDRCRFDPALGDGERDRYETANRLGAGVLQAPARGPRNRTAARSRCTRNSGASIACVTSRRSAAPCTAPRCAPLTLGVLSRK
ncbi:MAG: hypothetical protein M5U09_09875 [Gammaproteobacteria bacterium]|nr:hypothetical protein [Gammaproteobacteria bacterium]